MSSQFFYVQLKFTPKTGTDRVPVTKQHETVVEVPKDLVQRKQSENTSENSREKVIALDLARRVALGTFQTEAGRVLGLYDEDPPIWCADRPHVMNERRCDHEQNGTRAWRVVKEGRRSNFAEASLRTISKRGVPSFSTYEGKQK
jgi:hypothetical protein